MSERVLVLGATGFLGSWVCKIFEESDVACCNRPTLIRSSRSLGVDLRDFSQTQALFRDQRPDVVIHCAAEVGGIQYGYKYPARIFHDNALIIVNTLQACSDFGVRKIIQPVSNCAYPAKESIFKEENFWSGPLHDSVLVYGLTRKLMHVGAWAYHQQGKLEYLSLVHPNMYGPGDHFDEVRSHALGALIMKIVNAKVNQLPSVIIWGTGSPVREWMYVADAADSIVRAYFNNVKSTDVVNVGFGDGVSMKELAFMIREIVDWDGKFEFDPSKPDGAPCKIIDGALGKTLLNWEPKVRLREGLEKTIYAYMKGGTKLPS